MAVESSPAENIRGPIFGAKRNHLAQPRALHQEITDTEPLAILRSDHAGGSQKTSDSESPDRGH